MPVGAWATLSLRRAGHSTSIPMNRTEPTAQSYESLVVVASEPRLIVEANRVFARVGVSPELPARGCARSPTFSLNSVGQTT